MPEPALCPPAAEIGLGIFFFDRNGGCIILDSIIVLVQLFVSFAPVEIKTGTLGFEFDGLVEVGKSVLILSQFPFGESPNCISIGLFRFYPDGLVAIPDGAVVLLDLIVGISSVVEDHLLLGVNFQGAGKIFYGLLRLPQAV